MRYTVKIKEKHVCLFFYDQVKDTSACSHSRCPNPDSSFLMIIKNQFKVIIIYLLQKLIHTYLAIKTHMLFISISNRLPVCTFRHILTSVNIVNIKT